MGEAKLTDSFPYRQTEAALVKTVPPEKLGAEGEQSALTPRLTEILVAFLDANLDRFETAADPTWWKAPHNLAIRQTGELWKLWRFSILPTKVVYLSKEKALVVKPHWTTAMWGETIPSSMVDIGMLVATMRTYPTIRESVRKELDWIEKTFHIQVPTQVETNLLDHALFAARTYMGTDAHLVPMRVVPLDGTPSYLYIE